MGMTAAHGSLGGLPAGAAPEQWFSTEANSAPSGNFCKNFAVTTGGGEVGTGI